VSPALAGIDQLARSLGEAGMVRTIIYFFFAAIVLGVIAVPGLAAFGLLIAPLAGLGLIWRLALTVTTHGHPSRALVYTRQSHLLGPGGPDDSFANFALDEGEYPTEASARASVSARNGLVRGASVPRPRLSETLSVRPRGESSIQEAGG
jgi:hypothetical protein